MEESYPQQSDAIQDTCSKANQRDLLSLHINIRLWWNRVAAISFREIVIENRELIAPQDLSSFPNDDEDGILLKRIIRIKERSSTFIYSQRIAPLSFCL